MTFTAHNQVAHTPKSALQSLPSLIKHVIDSVLTFTGHNQREALTSQPVHYSWRVLTSTLQLQDTETVLTIFPFESSHGRGCTLWLKCFWPVELLTWGNQWCTTSAWKCWWGCAKDFFRNHVSDEILSSACEELRKKFCTPTVGWLFHSNYIACFIDVYT